ncbi:alpha/beta fold hydrolase [Streptomyces sp. NPDC057552]|uniref:alpha/beta fold hydrolase n=1 Tax=Streptomyces sp. NPDC057552 TaxID=3350537 RepID=UPI0036A251D6
MTGTSGTGRLNDSPGIGRSGARRAVRETGTTPGGTPYALHGTGEPIVLVAGAGGTGRIWEHHTVPALTAAGRLVVTFDHEAADEVELASTIGELLTSLELTSCPLVGHSLGALAVQELLLTDPRPAGGAVLVATRGRPDPVGEALARAEDACARAGIRLPPEYQASVRLAQNLSPRTLADDRAVTEWLDIFELAALTGDPAPRPARFTVTGDPAARPSRHTLTGDPAARPPRHTLTEDPAARPPRRSVRNRLAELGRITTPLLVVGFADDVLAPAPLGREVAGAVPGARYAELADTGHLGFLERPDAFHTVLLDFLATLPPTDPGALHVP